MEPVKVLTREYDCSQLAAFVFNGSFDCDTVKEYFERQGGFFGDYSSGAGGAYQKSHIWQGKHKTIAYIESGLDL